MAGTKRDSAPLVSSNSTQDAQRVQPFPHYQISIFPLKIVLVSGSAPDTTGNLTVVFSGILRFLQSTSEKSAAFNKPKQNDRVK